MPFVKDVTPEMLSRAMRAYVSSEICRAFLAEVRTRMPQAQLRLKNARHRTEIDLGDDAALALVLEPDGRGGAYFVCIYGTHWVGGAVFPEGGIRDRVQAARHLKHFRAAHIIPDADLQGYIALRMATFYRQHGC